MTLGKRRESRYLHAALAAAALGATCAARGDDGGLTDPVRGSAPGAGAEHRDRAGELLLQAAYADAAREAQACLDALGETAGELRADCQLELGRARFQRGDLPGAARALEAAGDAGALEAWRGKLLGEARLLGGESDSAAAALRLASRDRGPAGVEAAALLADALFDQAARRQSEAAAGPGAAGGDDAEVEALLRAAAEQAQAALGLPGQPQASRGGLAWTRAQALAAIARMPHHANDMAARAAALDAARGFWRDFPEHPAAELEPALEAGLRGARPYPAPSAHERYLRANHLLSAGQPARAAEEAKLARDGSAREGSREEQFDAALLWARALAADGRRGEAAIPLAEAIQSQRPHVAAQGLLLLARDRSRRGENADAVALLDKLAARFPASPEADEGALVAARLQLDAGQTADGRARLAKLGAKRTANAGEARWQLAWLDYRAGAAGAAARFAQCAALAESDDAQARAVYWEARSSQPALAAPLYARALELDPLGWYGLLARLHAGKEAAGSASPAASESAGPGAAAGAEGVGQTDVPPAVARLPEPRAGVLARLPEPARRLLRIGFGSEAAAELERAAQEARGDPARMVAVLAGFEAARRYDRSVPLAQSLLTRDALGARENPIDAALLAAAYPRAFPEAIAGSAGRANLDPALVLAVARRESVFKADARSAAGAVGLLQLLPVTARRAASVLGRPPPSDRELLEPELAAELGAWYLAELVGRFRDPAVAIAAYNAGPRAVASWVKPGEPLDAWVEEIPFKETRKYVKVVAGAWGAYRLLAGQPPPALDETIPEPGTGADF